MLISFENSILCPFRGQYLIIALHMNHSILTGMASPYLLECGVLKSGFVNKKNFVMQNKLGRQSFAAQRQ